MEGSFSSASVAFVFEVKFNNLLGIVVGVLGCEFPCIVVFNSYDLREVLCLLT